MRSMQLPGALALVGLILAASPLLILGPKMLVNSSLKCNVIVGLEKGGSDGPCYLIGLDIGPFLYAADNLAFAMVFIGVPTGLIFLTVAGIFKILRSAGEKSEDEYRF